ncbi:MAG: alpha/beta fold hydrolase [Myxococcales bacterium]|nr:alpha/beta fold hydrolase [Myxococcales bacterium]
MARLVLAGAHGSRATPLRHRRGHPTALGRAGRAQRGAARAPRARALRLSSHLEAGGAAPRHGPARPHARFARSRARDRPDASYAVDWYGRILAGLLAALGLGALDVVGHSFGGRVAQMQLLCAPVSTRRLVLVASGALELGGHLALRCQEGLGREHCDELAVMNATEGSARAFARTLDALASARRERRAGFPDRVVEIAAVPPIAVFWGTRDRVVPIAQGRKLSAALAAAFVPFEGCDHYLHHEQPEAFVAAVRSFLDAPSPRLAQAS